MSLYLFFWLFPNKRLPVNGGKFDTMQHTVAIFNFFRKVLHNTYDVTNYIHYYLCSKKCPIINFNTNNHYLFEIFCWIWKQNIRKGKIGPNMAWKTYFAMETSYKPLHAISCGSGICPLNHVYQENTHWMNQAQAP